MEEPSEKNLHRREGSKTPSRAESKSHTPPEPLGLSPFPGCDPSPQKGSGAEEGEGCHRDGKRNKARTQAGGGPASPPWESSTPRRGTGDHWGKLDRDSSRVIQLKNDLQHREEALRQQPAGAR